MASRGDAELIRSIGSIVGDVAGMLQATPQELQAARIAADETSQARSMEFTKEMENMRLSNNILMDEIETDANMMEHNFEYLQELDRGIVERGLNYEKLSFDKGTTNSQDNVMSVVGNNVKNTLNRGKQRLGEQSQQIDHRLAVLGHDIELEKEAGRAFKVYESFDKSGKRGILDQSEIDQARLDFVGTEDAPGEYTREEFDRILGFMQDNEADYWGDQKDKESIIAGEYARSPENVDNRHKEESILASKARRNAEKELEEMMENGIVPVGGRAKAGWSVAKLIKIPVVSGTAGWGDKSEKLQEQLNRVGAPLADIKESTPVNYQVEIYTNFVRGILKSEDLGDNLDISDAIIDKIMNADSEQSVRTILNSELKGEKFTEIRESIVRAVDAKHFVENGIELSDVPIDADALIDGDENTTTVPSDNNVSENSEKQSPIPVARETTAKIKKEVKGLKRKGKNEEAVELISLEIENLIEESKRLDKNIIDIRNIPGVSADSAKKNRNKKASLRKEISALKKEKRILEKRMSTKNIKLIM